MNKPTARQVQLLNFIKTYMKEYGITPTIREMTDGLGLKSTASTYGLFMRLVAQGYIIQSQEGSYRYSVKGMRYEEFE